MKNFLIAVDQVINTLVWAEGEGFGSPDETLSARAWRLRYLNFRWASTQWLIDAVFFWEEDHCMESFLAEVRRDHLRPSYHLL